ncbi:SGT1 protein-domain-containing protein, partial [Halteromyces radiatus]|uniref:SGT1 protein-domain-containing protein n=1 Tax=Halteromyces radiatus TaxID=101107 RepID=UPI0022202630
MESLKDVFNGTNRIDINYIQYSIYFPLKDTNDATTTTLHKLKALIDSQIIQPLTTGHIWQKDGFNLRIVRNDKKDPDYPFLFGITRFGDCMNDEWFIIYLLYEISKSFQDAIIAVSDNDGEVLLIEAAQALPPWLDPSNSDNRIYIYQGQLHIIPLPTSPADIYSFMTADGTAASKNVLTKKDAIDILRRQTPITTATDDIRHIILDRIQKYQSSNKVNISNSIVQQQRHEIHRARTILTNPQAVFVLLSAPQLLPLAVEAFYLRDPSSLKACSSMRQFSPIKSYSKNLILPWTRTTYAQTIHQSFYAPKPFHLPPKQHKDFDAAELGMKLMCGLEMLYAKDTGTEEWTDTDDVDQYDMLELPPTVLDGMTPKQKIDTLLQLYSPEALDQLITEKQESVEDDLAWLHVYPDELEAMLARKADGDDTLANTENVDIPVNLEEMMAKFEHFLENSQSGVAGVHLPGEEDSDEDDEDDDDDDSYRKDDIEEDMDKQISFDFKSFMDILNQGQQELSSSKDMQDVQSEFQTMMHEMDQEIGEHEKIAGSFVRNPSLVDQEEQENQEEEDEDAPVDIQLNLLQNVLESFKGQQGLPGPAGNLLRQFNIALPVDRNDDSDDEM